MDNEFIEKIECFAKKCIYSDDIVLRRTFYRSLTQFFLSNYKVEWFNVLSILSTNIGAKNVNTVAKWNHIAREIDENLTKEVVPRAGTRSAIVYVPTIKENCLEWVKANVFDIEQIVHFPKQYNVITPIEIAEQAGGDVITIDRYINQIKGQETFFLEYSKIYDDIFDQYSLYEKEYIKEVVFYSLTQAGICNFEMNFIFDYKILNIDILKFVHDLYFIIQHIPRYLLEKITNAKEVILQEEEQELVLKRSQRNLRQRIDDAKAEISNLET